MSSGRSSKSSTSKHLVRFVMHATQWFVRKYSYICKVIYLKLFKAFVIEVGGVANDTAPTMSTCASIVYVVTFSFNLR